MIRKFMHGLWLLALVAVPHQAASAGDPVVVTTKTTPNCDSAKHGKHHLFSWWAKHAAKPKDEGYERRKESCRFAFGPSGPYLYPEKYEPPLPPPMVHGQLVPMAPALMPLEP